MAPASFIFAWCRRAAALDGLRRWRSLALVIAAGSVTASAAPVLPLARPVDQARFTATTFATGLSFPTSMAELADGSLLVAFLPVDGRRSEGVVEIAMAPAGFGGAFVGGVLWHGRPGWGSQ
jgi:hypothetical protein